jgi:hypothetical protein
MSATDLSSNQSPSSIARSGSLAMTVDHSRSKSTGSITTRKQNAEYEPFREFSPFPVTEASRSIVSILGPEIRTPISGTEVTAVAKEGQVTEVAGGQDGRDLLKVPSAPLSNSTTKGPEIRRKLVIVGDSSVGKTPLLM